MKREDYGKRDLIVTEKRRASNAVLLSLISAAVALVVQYRCTVCVCYTPVGLK